MDHDQEKSMYDVADKFINLANELAQTDPSGSGLIGAALRFAAARYSAFQASAHAGNLAEEKEMQIELFSEDFKKMLDVNMNDYINQMS